MAVVNMRNSSKTPFEIIAASAFGLAHCLLIADAFSKFAAAKGTRNNWGIFAGFFLGPNPVIWELFVDQHFLRLLGYSIVLLPPTAWLDIGIRAETKRYGIKFKWRENGLYDAAIAERSKLEAAGPLATCDMTLPGMGMF